MKDWHMMLAVLTLALAIASYQRHPSGRRYIEVWLAFLGLLKTPSPHDGSSALAHSLAQLKVVEVSAKCSRSDLPAKGSRR